MPECFCSARRLLCWQLLARLGLRLHDLPSWKAVPDNRLRSGRLPTWFVRPGRSHFLHSLPRGSLLRNHDWPADLLSSTNWCRDLQPSWLDQLLQLPCWIHLSLRKGESAEPLLPWHSLSRWRLLLHFLLSWRLLSIDHLCRSSPGCPSSRSHLLLHEDRSLLSECLPCWLGVLHRCGCCPHCLRDGHLEGERKHLYRSRHRLLEGLSCHCSCCMPCGLLLKQWSELHQVPLREPLRPWSRFADCLQLLRALPPRIC